MLFLPAPTLKRTHYTNLGVRQWEFFFGYICSFQLRPLEGDTRVDIFERVLLQLRNPFQLLCHLKETWDWVCSRGSIFLQLRSLFPTAVTWRGLQTGSFFRVDLLATTVVSFPLQSAFYNWIPFKGGHTAWNWTIDNFEVITFSHWTQLNRIKLLWAQSGYFRS